MTRPRKQDRHLPACMYLKHGAYYLVRRGVWTRLGTDLAASLREYARRLDAPADTRGMPALIDTMLPRILRGKATETQRQYRACADILRAMLRQLDPHEVTPRDVKAVRRELQDTPGVANRTITVLKLILAEAVEDELIETNAAADIERIKMAPRTRRITAAEFDAIRANGVPLLRAVMALCYATGQRVMDVANIRQADISDEGVYFKQQKTGKELLVAWTDTLRAAVAEARALHPNTIRMTFLLGHEVPTYKVIYKRWRAACTAARVVGANIHDIRAMSATDAEAQGLDAQGLLGHTDERTTRIYLRDRTVPVVRGPALRGGKAA